MGVHPPKSASKWARLLACPGSMVLELAAGKEPPDLDTHSPPNTGTRAHQLGQVCLETGKNTDEVDTLTDELGTWTPDDYKDMRWHVQRYLDLVRAFLADAGAEATLRVESTVDPSKYTGQPGTGGTLDAGIISPESIRVIDLKYGQGHRYQPERLPQLMAYSAGLMAEEGRRETVIHTIIQPRIPDKDGEICHSWDCSGFDVEDQVMEWGDRLLEADLGLEFTRGDHCVFCRGKSICREFKGGPLVDAEKLFEETESLGLPDHFRSDVAACGTSSAGEMTTEWVGRLLGLESDFKALFKEARLRATGFITNGVPVPGFKLVDGKRSRAWVNDEDTTAGKLKNRGLKSLDLYPPRLIGPAAAAKLMKASGAKERKMRSFNTLWEWAKGAPVLAADNDPRDAVVYGAEAFEEEAAPADKVFAPEEPDQLSFL